VILADTSVLLDVIQNDQRWSAWSQAALEMAAREGEIAINDIVYSELSTRYADIEDCDTAIEALGLRHVPIPRAALFLAGKAFLSYRAQGGTKTSVLSDFFIGAHAAVQGWPLLTRDAGRVRTYFPTVKLIAPG
jgi:predicted nucleic acid-binding protein